MGYVPGSLNMLGVAAGVGATEATAALEATGETVLAVPVVEQAWIDRTHSSITAMINCRIFVECIMFILHTCLI
jgi:hypothetical protein